MLAQHLHDAAIGRQVIVDVERPADEAAVLDLEHVAESVGVRLVGAEQAEVRALGVARVDVAQHLAELARGLAPLGAGMRDLDRVVAEVGHVEIDEQLAAVGVRVGAHAAVARRRQAGQLGDELALGVEQLLRAVAAHPLFELGKLVRVLAHVRQRHLVRAEGALDRHGRRPPSDRSTLWACAGRWPASVAAAGDAVLARFLLDRANALVAAVERRGECLVHAFGVVALDEVDLVAVALQQARERRRRCRDPAPSGR